MVKTIKKDRPLNVRTHLISLMQGGCLLKGLKVTFVLGLAEENWLINPESSDQNILKKKIFDIRQQDSLIMRKTISLMVQNLLARNS